MSAKSTQKQAKSTAFPHAKAADSYVSDVLKGRITACKWVRLACERHVRDMEAAKLRTFPYRYDPEIGNRVCCFAELLPHVKGKWARIDPKTRRHHTLKLEPWQCFILCMVFGWVKKSNGKRRFSKARIYVPRKNGKSFFAAVIGWWMLAKDGEPGAEVYSGATSEKQAWEVFGPARQMAIVQPRMVAGLRVTVNAQSIIRQSDNSKFLPVIGKPGDGASPHCAIIDEFHEHKTSELIDTMSTGMGAREQPLELVISTAGSDIAGPCREDWKNCERILENTGGFEDETCFCVIYTIDDGDKWDCVESLQKANPNWGVSINEERLLAEMKVAQQSARKQSAFKTKYLNLWVTARDGYFNVSEWAKLERGIRREEYKDAPCYLGADLATKRDLTCIMQLFCLPDKRYAVFGKYYLPAATLDLPENQHYRNWQIQGWLETAGEDVTDFDGFKADAIQLCSEYQVEEFAFDPTRAWGVMPALEAEGLPMVEYRQTTLLMSEPMKQLEALIAAGRIIHNGDPILAWALGNVVAKEDAKSNVFPRKENEASKIDPVVSLLMALGRAMTRPEHNGETAFFAW